MRKTLIASLLVFAALETAIILGLFGIHAVSLVTWAG